MSGMRCLRVEVAVGEVGPSAPRSDLFGPLSVVEQQTLTPWPAMPHRRARPRLRRRGPVTSC